MRDSALDTHETWQCLLSDIINSLELFPRPFSSYRAWLDGITPTSTSFCWVPSLQVYDDERERDVSFLITMFNLSTRALYMATWYHSMHVFVFPLWHTEDLRFLIYHNLNRKVYLTQLEKIESTRPTAILNDKKWLKKKELQMILE